jgi:trimeric autotransporter adhesin
LHHKVKSLSLPAVDENVSFTTNERKSMSTKTFFKRISLTVTMALGLSVMAIAPSAQANKDNGAGITATCVMRSGVGGFLSISPTKTGEADVEIYALGQSYTRSGSADWALATPFTTTVLSTGTLTDTVTSLTIPLTAETAAATVGSLTYLVWADHGSTNTSTPGALDPSTTVTCTDAGAPTKFVISGATTATAGDTVTYTVTPTNAAGNATILKPNVETFTASITPAAGRSNIHAGRATGTAGTNIIGGAGLSDTITTGSAVVLGISAVSTATKLNMIGSTAAASMPYSYNNATSAVLKNSINLRADMADAQRTFRTPYATAAASTGPAVESATASGSFTIRVNVESNTTSTFAVEGAGQLANSVSGTAELTTAVQVYGTSYGFGSAAATAVAGYGITKGTTGWAAGVPAITSPTAAVPTGSISATAATTQTIKVSTARTSIPLTVQLSTAGVFTYTVAAVTNQPLPTGVTTGTFTTAPATGVETQTTITMTTTSPVAGQRFTVAWAAAANATHTVTFLYEAPSVGASLGESVSLRDTASSMKVAVGGTMSNEVIVRDQFGSLVSGASVNWSTSGRNNKATATTTTGANGRATIEWTDADSTKSIVTYPTDTLSVQATFGNSGGYSTAVTAAYTFVAALTATSITVVNNGAAAGTAANGSITVTINVLDAAGAGLSGYPVTVTSDSKSFVLTNGATVGTVYTNTAGQATATVYAKTAGTSTITLASGGKTATTSYAVIAGSHRTIALDAATASMAPGESKRVTATVKDSFGNPADGVSVAIAYTGTAGRVVSVNGVTSSTCTTSAAVGSEGTCVIELGSDIAGTGTLTVTVTGGDASTAVLNDGSARPTRVLTASTAVTVAGTSAAVTASNAATAAAEAATDAAAEAIDAANAATDAANLAAEAADAATVAAEEARDAADAATAAVEELATQVATLMAALKAQITTLANTVAKIAKKVKA